MSLHRTISLHPQQSMFLGWPCSMVAQALIGSAWSGAEKYLSAVMKDMRLCLRLRLCVRRTMRRASRSRSCSGGQLWMTRQLVQVVRPCACCRYSTGNKCRCPAAGGSAASECLSLHSRSLSTRPSPQAYMHCSAPGQARSAAKFGSLGCAVPTVHVVMCFSFCLAEAMQHDDVCNISCAAAASPLHPDVSLQLEGFASLDQRRDRSNSVT